MEPESMEQRRHLGVNLPSELLAALEEGGLLEGGILTSDAWRGVFVLKDPLIEERTLIFDDWRREIVLKR